MSAKVNLRTVVQEYIIESEGELALTQTFPRYMQIAISGLRELSTDVSSIEKEVELTVSDNLTVPLPDDYIDYIAIGFCCEGSLISMAVNKNLCHPDLNEVICSCEEEIDNQTPIRDDYAYSFAWGSDHFNKNGQFVGRYFGVSGGINSNGSYKIIDGRYIVFKGVDPGDEIILRYSADIDMSNGDILVHPFEREAIKAWIYWKKIQRKKNYSLGDKQLAQREFNRQKRMARNRHRELNVFEIVNAFSAGKKSSPKL